jgi:hypothetical protein
VKKALALASALGSVALAPEAAAQCRGRPTDAAGYQGYAYGEAEVGSLATERARVHYAKSGAHAPNLASSRQDEVPDSVAFAAQTAEDALRRFAEMGFRAPPSDASCASNGGDARLDVYLVAFAAADGVTVPEACTGSVCASFALVDSTFAGRGYLTPEHGFRTVITHELFHAVQNAYRVDVDRFWAEGTAQWAMKVLHPDLTDFDKQLRAFFAEPQRSLDTPPSGVTAGFLYGSAVWPLFLTQNHGASFVRDALEAEAPRKTTLEAIDEVLGAEGTSLADVYPVFGAWNAATGELAGTGGYPDAATYPGVKSSPLVDGANGITSGLSYFVYRGELDGPSGISLDTDPERNAAVVVPLEGGKARLERLARLPSNAEGEVLVVVAGITARKTDAPFTVRVGAPLAAGDMPDGVASQPRGDEGGCRAAGGSSSLPGGLAAAGLVLVALAACRSRRPFWQR